MQGATDKIWLWNEIRYSNERAFYQLYMGCYDDLFRYGLHLSGDKAQVKACINEVFAELWEKRAYLPDVEKPDGYLFIIFKRKMLRLVQKKQVVYCLPDEAITAFSNEAPSYEELLINSQAEAEQRLRIQRALDALTFRQKEIICLRYYEGLSLEEISDRLQISMRTVYNTVHSAITLLRKELQDYL